MGENVTRRSAVKTIAALPCAAAGLLLLGPRNAWAATAGVPSFGLTSGTVAPMAAQASTPSVSYCVHVQNDGWQGYRSDGEVAGTSGRSLRLEGIRIRLSGASGTIAYRTHVQNDGWQDWRKNDVLAGTTGRSLRLEAIQIKLEGDVADSYDVFYRVHVQDIGWMGWVKNGSLAGTTGRLLRLEAIQVKLVRHGTDASISYSTHVQDIGWMSYVGAGKASGTTGRSLRVEALRMRLDNGSYSGELQYCTHVQDIGWTGYVSADSVSGTTGRSLRVEAVRMRLTDELAEKYDLYYRAHVQNYGWLDWARNGGAAGSTGKSLRVEALEARLVAKGAAAPGSTLAPTADLAKSRLNGIDISSHQAGINISGLNADFVIVKATEDVDYVNPYMSLHANATLSSGKKLGLYHFAVVGDPIKQADYFVSKIRPYIGRAALFLDWENTGYSAGTMAQGPAWAKRFLDRVYQQTGVRPLIYMSQSVTNDYNWSGVASTYGLWLARYLYRNMNTGHLSNPDGATGFGYWKSAKLYQYSSTGRIGGYSGSLDLDVFYGTEADWDRMASKG